MEVLRTTQSDEVEMEFLRETEVCQKVKLSRVTIWRMEKNGLFPKRRQVAPKSVRWLRQEVEEWMQSREAVA